MQNNVTLDGGQKSEFLMKKDFMEAPPGIYEDHSGDLWIKTLNGDGKCVVLGILMVSRGLMSGPVEPSSLWTFKRVNKSITFS